MLPVWMGEVKGTMHIYRITNYMLADKVGITPNYLSSILSGEREMRDAEFRIRTALMELVKEIEDAEVKRAKQEEG